MLQYIPGFDPDPSSRMANILFISLLPGLLLAAVPPSTYMPTGWAKICQENVSNVTDSSRNVSTTRRLVYIQCVIPRSPLVHWRFNDLRDWAKNSNTNLHTSPTNRSVIYNLTLTCEPGANISLPWPMRAAGLVELHVTSCHIVDKYLNFNEPAIPDDLKVLEIRQSVYILNQTQEILKNSDISLNISNDFDCGQGSSIETLIMSNVTGMIMKNVDETENVTTNINTSDLLKKDNRITTPTSESITPSRPAKPENRLVRDKATANPDLPNAEAEADSVWNLITKKKPNVDPRQAQEAEVEHIQSIIKILNSRTKCNFTKLKIIDESISPINSYHHFEFMIKAAYYPVLETMNYSYFGLLELPEELTEWRIYFPKLKHLDVSHNYISQVKIPNYPHDSVKDIVRFDLRHNNITSLSMDIIKSWAEVDKFFMDIRDNPIHCGCDMAAMLPHLNSNSSFIGKLSPYSYVRYLYCVTPEELSGTQLLALTSDSLDCPQFESNQTAIIALALVLAVLVIFIAIIIKFKFEIRILLYTRLHIRLPCDADAQRHNKTFDAFVSYSNDDATWVYENLLAFLEKTPSKNLSEVNAAGNNNNNNTDKGSGHKPFRLCIHQRDFIPGKTIFDNIVDSIESSRHTIIVLSPSFMRSHWALEELRQAYRQSLVEKTKHLIVILLEKISNDEMDPLISRCCKTFTYLEVNDVLFKDRLVFSLTTKDRGAIRRDRIAAREAMAAKSVDQIEENIYDTVDTICEYDNPAYSSHRPSEPVRELSNMSTASTTALASS